MMERRCTKAIQLTASLLALCSACSNSSAKNSSGFAGPGLVAMAIGNPQPASPVVSKPSGFSNIVYYRLMMQGLHMGTAVVGRSSDKGSQEFVFELKLSHRLGYAPLLSHLSLTGRTENDLLTTAKQRSAIHHLESLVLEEESEWSKDSNDMLKLMRGNPENHLLRLGLKPMQVKSKVSFNERNIRFVLPFFEHKKSETAADPAIFNPLNGLPMAASDVVVKFANDGVAEELRLPWFGSLSLEFIRDDRDGIEKVPSLMPQNPLELAWFSNSATIQDDLRNLQTVAISGSQFARNSEKLIRKNFPQLPYLFHRKLFNFNKLCERIAFELSAANARRLPAEQVLTQVGWVIRNSLAEDHRELPRSLVNSPELEVLADDGKKWQWAKIISTMLNQTSEELGQVLAIEDSQKVNVSVRMGSRSLARGSVVKGMLRSGRLMMHHHVENAGTQALNPTSIARLPSDLLQPVKVALNQTSQNAAAFKTAAASSSSISPFQFINGQAFAKGEFPALSPLCEVFQGRIGLDLGNSKNELFSSGIVRGVWDESTRVQLIRQFARRASANTACRDIVMRAPGELATAAKSELESFRRDILQTEMEFQISVGSNRTVRLVPGTYELVISSLINGSIIGKREIIIPQGHDNLVLNLQL